jgi:hypothetical protein
MSWEQRLRQAAGVVIAVSLTGPILLAQKHLPSPAGLAGTWVLVPAPATTESGKPSDKEGRGSTGGSSGGFSGGLPGGGSIGFGNPAGPPDAEKIARVRRIMQAEWVPPRQLVIAVDGSQVTVTADDGRSETLVADGKKHLRLTGDGEVNTTTRWIDGQLVSVRRYDEGLKATRTLHIESDAGGARQLVLTLKVEGGRAPKSEPSKRVYRAQ